MTKEEAINKLESVKISLPAAKDEISEIIKLIESPWISVNDDLPYNHEELIKIIYQSAHYLIKGTKYVFVKYKNGHCGIDHMIKTSFWEWYSENSDIAYWMPITELPK